MKVALKDRQNVGRSPADCQFYQEQAKKLQVKEKEERDLANYYLTQPRMHGKQYPTPYENHEGLTGYYHQAGTQALEKADQQLKTAEPAHTSNLQ